MCRPSVSSGQNEQIMAREPFTLVLNWAEKITPSVKHFNFVREDAQPLDYTAGQFITIHFEHDGKTLRRSYSIANPPNQNNEIEFAAAYFEGGPGTEFLFNLQPGDKVQTTGPFGRLVLRDEQPQRYIMVATGTGVTPYRTMLPELHQRLNNNANCEVHVLLGVQHREDLLYADDFIAFAEQHPRAHFYACFSREETLNGKDFERQGYVQKTLDSLNLDREGDVIYLCGNPGMIDDVFSKLKEAEFDPHRIRREKYIS